MWRIAYDINQKWDIQYSPAHLKINDKEESILVEFKRVDNLVELRAIMYYNGYLVKLLPNQTIHETMDSQGGASINIACQYYNLDTVLSVTDKTMVVFAHSIFANCNTILNVATKR